MSAELPPLPDPDYMTPVKGVLYSPAAMRAYAAAAVAAERAWFAQVLSEWDSTADVEELLALRSPATFQA